MALVDQPFRALLGGALLLAAVVDTGCDGVSEPDADVGDTSPDAEGEDADVGRDDADEAEASPAEGGPVTTVAHTIEFVVDRLHDFDGDGLEDNAIADLGEPHSTLIAATFNAVFAGAIDSGLRMGLYLPWVDDLSAPDDADMVLIIAQLVDADAPDEPADDFDGDEPYYVDASALDECGEPPYFSPEARLDRGRLSVEPFTLRIPFSEGITLTLQEARVEGVVEPWGRTSEIVLSGYSPIGRLGDQPGLMGGDASMLEVLLAGGGALGYPTIPGVQPDVDVDGDGHERFVLDESGFVESCVDGDLTPIEGRDCWRDERMADGFTFAMSLEAVSARLVGREPAWEHRFRELCEGGLPEESIFGSAPDEGAACVGLGETCEPLLSEEPCCAPSEVCAAAYGGGYQCVPRCAPSPCLYDGSVPAMCLPAEGLDDDEGVCVPIALWHAWVECTPGTTGCATPYGVSESTYCHEVEGDVRTRCLEICQRAPSGCDEAIDYCLPFAYEGGGACVSPAPDR